jgi:hypothetical protein
MFLGRGIEHPGENITEGANPPLEQLLLFDQIKRGVVKKPTPTTAAETPARKRRG